MIKILKDSEGNLFNATIVSSVPEGFEDITDIMEIDVSIENEEKQYLEAIEIAPIEAVKAADEVLYVAPVTEVQYVPYQAAVAYVAPVTEVIAVAEHWTNGTDSVTDQNDIPTLLDENSDPYLDPAYVHVAAIEAVAPVTEVLAADEVLEVEYVAPVEEVLAVDAIIAVTYVPRRIVVAKKGTADNDRRNAILNIVREKRRPLLAEADIAINILFDADGDTSALKLYRQALRDFTAQFIKVDGDPKVIVDSIDLENIVWPTKP